MRLILIAAIALAVAPFAAAAQSVPASGGAPALRVPPVTQPPGATIMAEPVAVFIGACDANGDAEVMRDELHACAAKSFASIDTGQAGSLGYIAFADWAWKWLGDRNALPSPYETDRDGDNRITLAELTTQLDTTFTRLDRNKDDIITRDELLTLDNAHGPGTDLGKDRRRRGRASQ
ncbi:MAG: EF-hand domain-containing protein [Sphingomonas sp.]|jgi:hypothetical protein